MSRISHVGFLDTDYVVERNGKWIRSSRRNGKWVNRTLAAGSKEEAERSLEEYRVTQTPFGEMLYGRWTNARKRAKRLGVPFTLTLQDVESIHKRSRNRCELTGIPFSMTEPRGPWTPSLDRIIPSEGYVPENCRMICLAANQAIGKWGEHVLMVMAIKLVGRGRI